MTQEQLKVNYGNNVVFLHSSKTTRLVYLRNPRLLPGTEYRQKEICDFYILRFCPVESPSPLG